MFLFISHYYHNIKESMALKERKLQSVKDYTSKNKEIGKNIQIHGHYLRDLKHIPVTDFNIKLDKSFFKKDMKMLNILNIIVLFALVFLVYLNIHFKTFDLKILKQFTSCGVSGILGGIVFIRGFSIKKSAYNMFHSRNEMHLRTLLDIKEKLEEGQINNLCRRLSDFIIADIKSIQKNKKQLKPIGNVSSNDDEISPQQKVSSHSVNIEFISSKINVDRTNGVSIEKDDNGSFILNFLDDRRKEGELVLSDVYLGSNSDSVINRILRDFYEIENKGLGHYQLRIPARFSWDEEKNKGKLKTKGLIWM